MNTPTSVIRWIRGHCQASQRMAFPELSHKKFGHHRVLPWIPLALILACTSIPLTTSAQESSLNSTNSRTDLCEAAQPQLNLPPLCGVTTRASSLEDDLTRAMTAFSESDLNSRRKKIETRLKHLLTEQLGLRMEEISDNSHLICDLGADDIDIVELMMAIETEFSLEIPHSAAEQLRTFSQTRDYLAVVEFIHAPTRDASHLLNEPFLMAIEDVFSIKGRGTVATGRVSQGMIRTGDQVEIVGLSQTRTTVAMGIEMFRKLLDTGYTGDNIGVLLKDVLRDDIERGHVLAAPGSISAHRRFDSEIYLYAESQGGRHTPAKDGHSFKFYFRTVDIPGTIDILDPVDQLRPGSTTAVTTELAVPIAMVQGTQFAIREKGRTVGCGKITRIME